MLHKWSVGILLAGAIGIYVVVRTFSTPLNHDAPPATLGPEETELPPAFLLLLEGMRECREICGAEDEDAVGVRLNPETLEGECICPDGTKPKLSLTPR